MIKIMGYILFFLSLGIFAFYMLNIYLPAIQLNPNNSDALINAIYWAIGCGIFGTIGAMIVKESS